jgi:prepilin peptidase CpaA
VRTRTIPNAIPIAVAVIGLVAAATAGWRGFGSAIGAGSLVLLIGTIPFGLGLIGGGDVKLLAACACVFGLGSVLPLVIYTALLGGVFAVCVAAATGELRAILSRTGRRLAPALSQGAAAPAPPSPTRLPYAVAIAGGVIWVILGDTLLPVLKFIK